MSAGKIGKGKAALAAALILFLMPALGAAGLALVVMMGSSSVSALCQPAATNADSADDSTPSVPENTDLFNAIKIVTKGEPRLVLANLQTTYLESKWGINVVAGGAYGNYQIQNPGKVPGPNPSITVAQALDPGYSARYMAPRYAAAMRSVDPKLWSTDPQGAAELVGYRAERPRVIYHTPPRIVNGYNVGGQGPEAVRTAYVKSIKKMQEMGVSVNFSIENFTPLVVADPSATQGPSNPTVAASDLADICNPYQNISANLSTAATVISAAQTYLGYPYVYGGGGIDGPSRSPLASGNAGAVGFDASGLTQYAYHKAGISIPRLASAQYEQYPTKQRKLGNEQAGDLVFFGDGKGISHVGIVVDPDKRTMINAPRSGLKIQYESYRGDASLVGFVHLLPDNKPVVTGIDLIGPEGFPGGQCGVFVSYIVRRHIPNFPSASMGYYGKDFASNLGRAPFGFEVNNTPAIRAVVSFPPRLSDPDGVAGHVAIVSGIYPNGDILVEEANWTVKEGYGTHVVKASIARQLTYAHTEVRWRD